MSDAPAIAVRNYSYVYPSGKTALSEVTLDIETQQHTALMGPNGSGKSTLLRSIVGILRGDGDILVLDKKVKKTNLREIRKRVGYLFQDPQVQLFCPTVLEDAAFGPLNYHGEESRAITEAETALSTVGYDGNLHASIHSLSLGEMRKVALAGILAVQPTVLLLDEPDAFLDEQGKEHLVDILHSLKGITIILVTHDKTFASKICSRVIRLNKSSVISDESFEIKS